MVLRTMGAAMLAQLMRAEREGWAQSDWLLHGPTDPEVVQPPEEAPPLLLAAE